MGRFNKLSVKLVDSAALLPRECSGVAEPSLVAGERNVLVEPDPRLGVFPCKSDIRGLGLYEARKALSVCSDFSCVVASLRAAGEIEFKRSKLADPGRGDGL